MKKVELRRWRRPRCTVCGAVYRGHDRFHDHKYEYDPKKDPNLHAMKQAELFASKAKEAKSRGRRPSEI